MLGPRFCISEKFQAILTLYIFILLTTLLGEANCPRSCQKQLGGTGRSVPLSAGRARGESSWRPPPGPGSLAAVAAPRFCEGQPGSAQTGGWSGREPLPVPFLLLFQRFEIKIKKQNIFFLTATDRHLEQIPVSDSETPTAPPRTQSWKAGTRGSCRQLPGARAGTCVLTRAHPVPGSLRGSLCFLGHLRA